MMRSTRSLLIFLMFFVMGAAQADVMEIDTQKLEQLSAAGAVVIDVRRPDEWAATGIVEGSHPLTFFDRQGRYNIEAWLDELDSVISPELPVVLICASGVRSGKIATFLASKLDFTQVYNVTDGINAWLAEEKPVIPYKP